MRDLSVRIIDIASFCTLFWVFSYNEFAVRISEPMSVSWQDVAASYGLGAVGGYVYLRMLHRSVDAVAGEGDGSSTATRLLVPVVLVLAANR